MEVKLSLKGRNTRNQAKLSYIMHIVREQSEETPASVLALR